MSVQLTLMSVNGLVVDSMNIFTSISTGFLRQDAKGYKSFCNLFLAVSSSEEMRAE